MEKSTADWMIMVMSEPSLGIYPDGAMSESLEEWVHFGQFISDSPKFRADVRAHRIEDFLIGWSFNVQRDWTADVIWALCFVDILSVSVFFWRFLDFSALSTFR
jgi:hypothetical protein